MRKFGSIKFQSKTVKNTKNMSKNCAFLLALATFFELIQNCLEYVKETFKVFLSEVNMAGKNPFSLEFQIFCSLPLI